MSKIKYDQSVVIGCLGNQANGVATTTRSDICRIDVQRHNAIVGIKETAVLRGRLVDVIDISFGRVVFLKTISMLEMLEL